MDGYIEICLVLKLNYLFRFLIKRFMCRFKGWMIEFFVLYFCFRIVKVVRRFFIFFFLNRLIFIFFLNFCRR